MEQLGRQYLLHEEIGQGASAIVRRATSRRGGPELAAKLLRPHLAADPRVRAVLLREEAALRDLNHPAVAALRDVVAEPGVLALVTDFVDGRNLRRQLTNSGGVLPAADAAAFAAQIAGALAVAHAQGVLHLDLTPENVLVLRDGPSAVSIKVTDFGVTALLREAGAGVPASGYEAPELARGGLPTAAADVYALGLLTAEIVSGVRPDAIDSLSALPPVLRALVSKLLSPEPWERPSARSAAAQFRSIAGRLSGDAQPELPTPGVPVPPPRADLVSGPHAGGLIDPRAAAQAGAFTARPAGASGPGQDGLSSADGQPGLSGSSSHGDLASGSSSSDLVVGEWIEDESTIRAEAWLGAERADATTDRRQIPFRAPPRQPGRGTPGPADGGPAHGGGSPLGPAPSRRRWTRKRTVIASSAAALTAFAALAVTLDAVASDDPVVLPTPTASTAASTAPAPDPTTVAPVPIPTETVVQKDTTRATYAAHLPNDRGTLYVALRDGKAVAYLCDGKRVEAWFSGTAANGSVSLSSKKGAKLTGAFTAAALNGQYTLQGETVAYDIPAVHKPSGLYRASGRVRNAKVSGGWIILADGRQVGILTVGETSQPAPELSTTSGTATLDGTTVTSDEVDTETGKGFQ